MKKYLCIISFSMISFLTFAQTNISKVSLEIGITRHYQPDLRTDRSFAFSPAVEVGGAFISDYFEWEAGLSYWWDGVRNEFDISDSPTYSYSSTSLGLRLNYFPKYRAFPIHFISGVSTRLVREKYIGGGEYDGSYRNDNSFMLYTLDFGTGVDVRVADNIRLRFDGLLFMPFVRKDILDSGGWGSSLKVGIDYYFPHRN